MLAWRKTSTQNFNNNFTLPVILSLSSSLVFLLFGLRGYVVISLMLSVFVIASISMEFNRGIKSRVRRFNEPILSALITLIKKNRSRYGGYFVHLGIVLMFIGFTGQAFNLKKEIGIPKTLGEIGVKSGDISFLSQKAFEIKRLLRYNQRFDIKLPNYQF